MCLPPPPSVYLARKGVDGGARKTDVPNWMGIYQTQGREEAWLSRWVRLVDLCLKDFVRYY